MQCTLAWVAPFGSSLSVPVGVAKQLASKLFRTIVLSVLMSQSMKHEHSDYVMYLVDVQMIYLFDAELKEILW